MKPVRDKKPNMSNSIRKKLGQGKKIPDPKLVEVCELQEEANNAGSGRSRGGKTPAISDEICTPLGAPSAKKRKKERKSPPQVSALNLTPAATTRQGTQVTIIDTSFQDDSGNSSSPSPNEGTSSRLPPPVSSTVPPALEESFSSNSSRSEQLSSSLSSSLSSFPSDEGGDFADGLDAPLESSQEAIGGLNDGQNYALISLEYGSSYLLLLQGGTRMPVRGLAKIFSLYGTVSIHGYEISPQTPQPVPIHCPYNVSSKCLETGSAERRQLEQAEKDALLNRISALKPCSMTAQDVVSEMRSDSVLLLVSRLDHQSSSFITSHMTYKNLYSGGSAKKTLQKTEIVICDKVGLFVYPGTTHYQNVIQLHQDYDSTAQALLEGVRRDSTPPKVMFVGTKNSGKSTALRYLANRLLTVSQDVGYLECDPGQCEFTAPAILSLHTIKQPLLGPPFTHLQKAEKAFFLGDVSVDDHAENYLKMIAALYKKYCDSLSSLPLFINTMGWVEGLGLKLLREVARITQPTHIVHLVAADDKPVAIFSQDEGDLSHFNIPSVTNQHLLLPKLNLTIEAKCQTDSYQASSQRELNLLAAFSRLLPLNSDAKRLTDISPRVVQWRDVVLHICHMSVPVNQILYAANASVVALCTTSKAELDRCNVQKGSEGLRTLTSTPVSECLGIGIIRGIDPQKKAFYILPALPSDLLPKVNTLLVGSPFIPECVFDQQFSTKGAPYVSESFDTNVPGSLPIHPKTYLKRGPGVRPPKT